MAILILLSEELLDATIIMVITKNAKQKMVISTFFLFESCLKLIGFFQVRRSSS